MLKKFISTLIIITLILGMCASVNAAQLNTKLLVNQQASETKYLENDQGFISKTIVDSNAETGEVTIELKVANVKKQIEETTRYENTEVYMMVSENIVNDNAKLAKYINDIKVLANKIFEANSNIKIGIIGIKGTINDKSLDEDGKMITGENDQGDVNGTAENAEIVVNLTNNIDVITNGIQNMNSSKTKYYVNLQAAIRLANKNYSDNTNKILISLYDNVPSIAIGVKRSVSIGGLFGGYSTTEEAVKAKHENIVTRTRDEILSLKKSNIEFILLRPDDTSYDETWYDKTTGEKDLEFDGSPYVKKLYGTIENPTYGKMYNFTDDNINSIITENIYQDVKNIIQSNINTVKIVDYFPSDIVDNFEFSYVGNASIGTVSNGIDEENKTISWDIGTLKGNETATLRYKLKIKDMQNEELLNKVISTNEKVVLTYKDVDNKDYTVTLSSSPKIQLADIKEGLIATVSYDITTPTTGNVIATIRTNKKVNPVDGWNISEDGMTLTKTYSKNATEAIHLVDIDGKTADVTVSISNIQNSNSNNNNSSNNNNKNNNDDTSLPTKLPQTGVSMTIVLLILSVVVIAVISYRKYNKYKEIR